jgi:hypothetical protein
MRQCATVLAIALLASPARAQTPRASTDSAAIVALEFELSKLLEHGAWDKYAEHLTPDYARTTSRGTLETREQALAGWRAQGPGRQMVPTQIWVRVHGDAAVLTATVVGPNGGPGARITKTFVREDGRWLLLSLHTSAASASP